VTFDGFGEKLGPALAEFVAHLRALGKAAKLAKLADPTAET